MFVKTHPVALMGRLFLGAATILASSVQVLANEISDIHFAELPGHRFEIKLDFEETPEAPKGYNIEKPARVVLDFSGVESKLAKKKFPIAFEGAKSVVVLSGSDRTRMIVNLDELVSYTTRIEGNSLFVEMGNAINADYIEAGTSLTSAMASQSKDYIRSIDSLDFRRGDKGEGKLILGLSEPNVNIDADNSGGSLKLTFSNVALAKELRRRLDVTDFATPVTFVDAKYDGGDTKIVIDTSGEYDYLAYQADEQYVVSIKPLTEAQRLERQAQFQYVGKKLSLNFQNIEVRSVLQLIADFTDLNLVASDTVTGDITLRLDNVPWDQALNLVLKTKGLDKRQVGNVLMVAPAAEIAERERQELETKKQLQELAPLRTEYIRVRYANAKELFKLFDGEGGGGEGGSTGSILSERGQAIVDERTNSIILTDTSEKIAEFIALVKRIDIPVRQVLVEARIVVANTDYRKEMGVKWTALGSNIANRSTTSRTARVDASGQVVRNDSGGIIYDTVKTLKRNVRVAGRTEAYKADNFDAKTGAWTPTIDEASLVDLGVSNPFGSLAFWLTNDNGSLGLELSALEDSGFAEIVSQPKVITGDKQTAFIESGKEIPYQEASASGATSTSFKEAVLKLEVTPQITPDDQIIMDLNISQDSIGNVDSASSIPIIDVNQLKTQVLVANGQTVVLGGIFQDNLTTGESKVPVLGDIPYLGRLFRKDLKIRNKRELLIFITPKIIAQNITN